MAYPRKFLGIGLLTAAFLARPVIADEKAESVSQQIDDAARQVLSGVQKTSYTHKLSIDADKGVYQTDASGLLNWVLQKASPAHLQAVKLQGKETRPLAQDYWATLHAAPTSQPSGKNRTDQTSDTPSDTPSNTPSNTAARWRQIVKVGDLRPGDVVAVKSASESSESISDAGTVMIVDEKPVEEPKQPDSTKTEKVRGPRGKMEEKQVKVPPADAHRLYRVVVIDSSKSLHAADSRAVGTTGVGRGTIWIDIDSAGRAIGLHWTAPTGKLAPAAIVLGRAGSN